MELMISGFKDLDRYWQAIAECLDMACPFDIDIICEEDAREDFVKEVKNRGKKL